LTKFQCQKNNRRNVRKKYNFKKNKRKNLPLYLIKLLKFKKIAWKKMMKNNSIENRKKFNFLTKLVKGEKLAHKSSILEKKINIINESNPSETKFWNSIQ
jgi:hypothetical protein